VVDTNVGILENRSSSGAIATDSLNSTSTPNNLFASTSLDSGSGAIYSSSSSSSSSNGLEAEYYEGTFGTLLKSRVDPTVNFNWGTGSPDPGVIPADNFSVRWTGQIQPQYSENYTFYTTSDDGVRLWVNGQLLIDNWNPHAATEDSGTVSLTADQKYDIKLEYYERGGNAVSTLSWASATQAKQIIPQSQLFQASNLYEAAVGETAKSAYSFVDSIGINTHLHYYDTSYGNFSLIEQRLQELGVHHIRDGGSDPTWIQRINELATKGIKSTIVIDPNIGVGPNASYDIKPPGYTINDLVKKMPSAIEAVEMLNEFDINYYNGYSYNGQPVTSSSWATYVRDFTRDSYTALKADPATQNIPIIGPSFVYADSSTAVGDLKSWLNYGNLHPYNNPSYPGDGNLQSDMANRSKPSGNLPLIATETGYFTGNTTSDRGVSEMVQSKYIPRLLLENFNSGITRTFPYELIDQWPNSDNSENNFGLLHADGSPKPAFTAEKNLISLLSDTSSSFTLGSLNYSLGGNTQNLHHTLLQKSNKDFYLVLWLEVPSTDQAVSQSVTLNLSTPISQATTYLPNQSTTSTAQYTTPTQLALNVPDHPLVVQLTPN
jgi:hypothetical protein